MGIGENMSFQTKSSGLVGAMRFSGILLTVLVSGGCVGSKSTPCGAQVCPPSFECDSKHDLCVQPLQLVSCIGEPDGALCTVNEIGGFHCDQEVCIPGVCGDGVADSTEECDEGAANSSDQPDACRPTCRLPRCGDGVIDPSNMEACDDGAANSSVTPDACRETCQLPRCGDGVVDPDFGELCDDGNHIGGDGCGVLCHVELCGNGIVEPAAGEGCDCGTDAANPATGCSAENGAQDGECSDLCQPIYCGNGVIDAGEECDDGNVAAGDNCGPTCQEEECGNGFPDPGEQCDDGLLNSDTTPNTCRTTCRVPGCGDGVIDAGEACDDGDRISGNGCSSDCLSVESCGNGVVDGAAGEECDDGNLRSHDGCSSGCTAEALTWQRWKDPLQRREHPGMAYDVARDRVVLFGGVGSGGPLDDTWELDGEGWRRIKTAHRPPARASHVMAYDAERGVVVLFGGAGSTNHLNDTWEYDGADWRPIQTAHSPSSRSKSAMAYDGARQEMVLFGGEDDCNYGSMQDTWTYDGIDWVKRAPATSVPRRMDATMAYDSQRQVVVYFGGMSNSSWTRWNETWEWNGTTWTHRTDLVTRPLARGQVAMAYDVTRQRMVLFGGNYGYDAYEDTWEYYGTAWTPVSAVASPPALYAHGAAWSAAAGGVVLFGGRGSEGVVDDSWVFDGATWTRRYATHPSARWDASASYDSLRDRIVLYGGTDAQGDLGDTWEFDGQRWSQVQTPGSPGPRSAVATAYDSDQQRTLLFGGSLSSSFQRDVWEFDGSTWVKRTALPQPPAVFYGPMVYDSQRHRAVLTTLEGIGSWGPTLLTYELNGSVWSLRSPTVSPNNTRFHAAVYDPDGLRTLLFGGFRTFANADTWSWDGNNWTQLQPAIHPDARLYMSMTWDSDRGCGLLYGGLLYSNGVGGDTWALCGTEWEELQPTDSPGPRYKYAMAHQPTRRQTLLFGGLPGTDDQTWLLRYVSAWPDEVCQSGVDDDGDGLVDCDDPDCQGVGCERCDSGVDDDGDGLVDCEDSQCSGRPCGSGQGLCADGVCTIRACGDGYLDVDLGEECDDGNTTPGDGCEPSCSYTCASGSGALSVRADATTNFCVAGFPQTVTRADAEAHCVSLGGHLATILDAADNDLVGEVANSVNCGWLWMGLTDEGNESIWSWPDGTVASYFNWKSTDPNGGTSENCGVIHGYLKSWGDAPCTWQVGYLCSF